MNLNENSVFAYEKGFNLYTRRSYAYLAIHKAYITASANKNVNRSLICAININGIIEFEYKTGGYNTYHSLNLDTTSFLRIL